LISIISFFFYLANDSILDKLPMSEERKKWEEIMRNPYATDPNSSNEAVQSRLTTVRDILRRPDPRRDPDHVASDERKINPNPELEEDITDQYMSEEDRMSLREVQTDLKEWWKGSEEADFHERLEKFKAKKGDNLFDAEVYDFWIDEWTRKVKEISNIK
jgi:hypothetical protein